MLINLKSRKYIQLKNANVNSIFFLITICSIILSLYGLHYMFKIQDTLIAIILYSLSFITIMNGLFLKILNNMRIFLVISTAILFVLFASIVIFSPDKSAIIYWISLFPLILFMTMDVKNGIFLIAIFDLLLLILLLLASLGLLNNGVKPIFYIELLGLFSVVSCVVGLYEFTLEANEVMQKKQYFYDPLTNLPNRRMLMKEIKDHQELTLILINVDGFKELNDFYGAKGGDKTLLEIAKRLLLIKEQFQIKHLFRLHADEFAIVLMGNTKENKVINLSNKISESLSEKINIEGNDISISVSIGISDSSRDILADTDIALQTAKEENKPFIIYDKSLRVVEKYQDNIQQLYQIRKGISENNLVPFFQPIIDNGTGEIKKYECLARLLDNDKIIYPNQFLDLSRRAKIYPTITKSIIEKSFDFFKDKNIDFSINLCLEDLVNRDTTEYIYSALRSYDIGNRVIFEFLESDRILGKVEVLKFIEKVKELGCRIAIDDFGSGYANFEYLIKMNFDYLKLDSSIIRDLANDKNSKIITETIVDFSKRLNIKTIAEYVHDEHVHDIVKKLGIDFSQGYYVGKPKPDITQ